MNWRSKLQILTPEFKLSIKIYFLSVSYILTVINYMIQQTSLNEFIVPKQEILALAET